MRFGLSEWQVVVMAGWEKRCILVGVSRGVAIANSDVVPANGVESRPCATDAKGWGAHGFVSQRQTEGKRGAGKNRKGAYSQCCRKSGNLLTASAKW